MLAANMTSEYSAESDQKFACRLVVLQCPQEQVFEFNLMNHGNRLHRLISADSRVDTFSRT